MDNLKLKTVKIYLLFSLIAVSFLSVSCNSDNDTFTPNPSFQDPFIGAWTFDKEIVNGKEYIIEDCFDKEFWLVKPDGTHEVSYFDYNDDYSACSVDMVESNRKWENLGDGRYKLTRHYGTEYEYIEEFTFIFTGNTLSIINDINPNALQIYIKS